MSGQQGKAALPEIEPTAYVDALPEVSVTPHAGCTSSSRVEIIGRGESPFQRRRYRG